MHWQQPLTQHNTCNVPTPISQVEKQIRSARGTSKADSAAILVLVVLIHKPL